MRTLLFDIGNTRIKWGVGEIGEIHRTGHIAQEKIREQGLAALTTKLPDNIDAVAASNVAGQTFATRLAGVVGAHYDRDIHFIRPVRAACGVTNGYRQPRRMGADRWAAIVGAWSLRGRACLVVDAGTAVTIDAIDGNGNHLGGQILPGTRLMAESLAADTSDLPPTPPANANAFLGLDAFARNTRTAIQSGVLGAVAGAIEHGLKALRVSERGAGVILTGGDASRILGLLAKPPLHRPHLVLEGLLRLQEGNSPRNS